MLIYIADDDKDICFLIQRQLMKDGFIVKSFYLGQELYDEFIETPCDLIITDVLMPGLSGFEMCTKIRHVSHVPIIIISANGEEEKRLRGYELGSDDYITKPFSLKELSLKVRNMLKRAEHGKQIVDSTSEQRVRDLVINNNEHQVFVNQVPMNVSEKEYCFIHLLITNKNKALAREFLIEKIWGYEFVEDTRLLDHVVKRIRKKLIEHEARFKIETVWGFGYKVCDE